MEQHDTKEAGISRLLFPDMPDMNPDKKRR